MGGVRTRTASVIVPTRNAARQIGGCLTALCAPEYLHELTEVVVVDESLEDGAAAVAIFQGPTLLRQPSRGPGAVVGWLRPAGSPRGRPVETGDGWNV